MKTKVLFVLVVFSIISFNCIVQSSDNEFVLGIVGPAAFDNRIQHYLSRNSENESHHFFNPVYIPLAGTPDYSISSRLVINKMAYNEQVTEEQVGIIFNKIRNFPHDTQLSIAFIKDGCVSFYGSKIQNSNIVNIDNQSSVFETGSITKLFTATLLANSINEGTVAPDDNINNYLPFELNDSIQISFKELANHTSGLPRNPSNMGLSAMLNSKKPYKNYSEIKLEKYLTKKMKVTRKSGNEFRYSNIGFGILGYILCQNEGKSYNDLLRDNIFTKYGMMNSSTCRKDLESKLVFAFDKSGSKVRNWDFGSLESAGAVLSTTEDLSKFIIAQFNELNKELALLRENTFNINENSAMGLAWFISKTESGETLYSHKGITGGYKSAIAFNFNKKTGIVILSNVSGFNKEAGNIESLCFDLLTTITKE